MVPLTVTHLVVYIKDKFKKDLFLWEISVKGQISNFKYDRTTSPSFRIFSRVNGHRRGFDFYHAKISGSDLGPEGQVRRSDKDI